MTGIKKLEGVHHNSVLPHLLSNIIKKKRCVITDVSLFLSLLSDSNQRPRDYKSRALAN